MTVEPRPLHRLPSYERAEERSDVTSSVILVQVLPDSSGSPFPGAAPARTRWSKVVRITGDTGKASGDETVAAGLVVAMKRGNARGAKEPCCS